MSELELSKKSKWSVPQVLRPLRIPNFALLWTGQSLSRLGNSVYEVALGWTVFALTGSATSMGLVLAAFAIPQVLFLLMGGVFGDRYKRKTILLVADLVAALAVGLVAFMLYTDQLSLPFLIALSACLGIVDAFYGPTYGPLIRDTVPEEEIQQANALDGITQNSLRIIGPALGGALYAFAGADGAFAFNAATFLLAAVATIFIRRLPKRVVEMRSTVASEIKEAFHYTLRTRWLLYVIGLSVVVNVFAIAPFFVLLPVVVSSSGLPVTVLGLTLAAQGLAGVAVGVFFGRVQQSKNRGYKLFALATAIGLANVLLGLFGGASLIILSGAVLGLGFGAGVLEHTLIQQYVPEELLSRVYSLNMVGSFALFPVAYALAGLLAGFVGVNWVLITGGVVEIVFCIVAMRSHAVKNLS